MNGFVSGWNKNNKYDNKELNEVFSFFNIVKSCCNENCYKFVADEYKKSIIIKNVAIDINKIDSFYIESWDENSVIVPKLIFKTYNKYARHYDFYNIPVFQKGINKLFLRKLINNIDFKQIWDRKECKAYDLLETVIKETVIIIKYDNGYNKVIDINDIYGVNYFESSKEIEFLTKTNEEFKLTTDERYLTEDKDEMEKLFISYGFIKINDYWQLKNEDKQEKILRLIKVKKQGKEYILKGEMFKDEELFINLYSTETHKSINHKIDIFIQILENI